MSLFDRLGDVVRSEWTSRFTLDDEGADGETPLGDEPARTSNPRPTMTPSRARKVPDAESARRILELPADATLDEVRAAYRRLARRYHPKTISGMSDKAYAAQALLDTLTDAVEILEAHLLPLPDGTRD